MKRYLHILAIIFGTRIMRSLLFGVSLSGTIEGIILHRWTVAIICAFVLVPITVKSIKE